MYKKYKELTGTISSCAVDYNAVIVTEDGEIITSQVLKITMVLQNKFYFETENSFYIVTGAMK